MNKVNTTKIFKGKSKGRVFKSGALEFLTKTSPAVTLMVHIPIIISLLLYGHYHEPVTLKTGIIVYVSGLFTWTLMEYLIHRYVFHFVNEWSWTKRFHYIVHGVHHEYPLDDERQFMPPIPTLIYATIFFSVFRLLLGPFSFYFMPGLMNGYLIYSFTHWSIHNFPPPKALRFLWRHHQFHHYKTPDKAFGVSSMFWDIVFGTLPPKK